LPIPFAIVGKGYGHVSVMAYLAKIQFDEQLIDSRPNVLDVLVLTLILFQSAFLPPLKRHDWESFGFGVMPKLQFAKQEAYLGSKDHFHFR